MDKRAFTLAEVLITLGIIGVVAAITMPVLIQNYRKHEVETKLKHVYSMMNQAIKMSEAEYDEVTGWTDWNNTANSDEKLELFKKYIGKHLEIIDIKRFLDENNNILYHLYLKNGSILETSSFNDYSFFINNKALKNRKVGVNAFLFRFSPSNNIEFNKYHYGKGFEPYAYYWQGTEDDLYHSQSPGYGCGDEYGLFCTKLIQYNGWKIPNNYPLKF